MLQAHGMSCKARQLPDVPVGLAMPSCSFCDISTKVTLVPYTILWSRSRTQAFFLPTLITAFMHKQYCCTSSTVANKEGDGDE